MKINLFNEANLHTNVLILWWEDTLFDNTHHIRELFAAYTIIQKSEISTTDCYQFFLLSISQVLSRIANQNQI